MTDTISRVPVRADGVWCLKIW